MTTKTEHSSARRRLILWIVVVAIILTCSWFKASENRVDREEQKTWREIIAASQTEFKAGRQRIWSCLESLGSRQDAKQQIERLLNDGEPLDVENDGKFDVAYWTDPKTGIQVKLNFVSENRLVSSRVSYNNTQLGLLPQPPRHSLDSRAESIRKLIARPAMVAWFLAFIVAVSSNRFGQIAAESMVVFSLACGAAWLVNPVYWLTVQGVLSNDLLGFALMMYLASVIMLAMRTPRDHALLRFKIRTLMAITAVIAVLIALGPLGYVSLLVFAFGGVMFISILQLRSGNVRDPRPNQNPKLS